MRWASRPTLDLVLTIARASDTIVVTRLDRLGRSTLHLVRLGASLRDRKVGLKVIEQGIDTDTAEGRAMFWMLSGARGVPARTHRRQYPPRAGRLTGSGPPLSPQFRCASSATLSATREGTFSMFRRARPSQPRAVRVIFGHLSPGECPDM